jgi:hypothetical protein
MEHPGTGTEGPSMVDDQPTQRFTVSIWHHLAFPHDFLSGWKPRHPVVKVFAYVIPAEQALHPDTVLEQAFTTFNVGEDTRAGEYRARGLRSLSKGDVVTIGEVAWACASTGWEQIATITVADGYVV